ncbi:hypothetical protein [Variovorax soli]|uniref:hypothetical protein n=1 Tax=Variovorax soli TaxID=376815 RepID=UPI00083903D9|nr:hypothetical protein [Variovorax soli]
MSSTALHLPAPLRHLPMALALSCALPLAWSADDSARLSSMSESELEAGMKSGVQVVMQRVPIQMEDQSVLVGAEYEPASRVATYHYMQARGLDPMALRTRLTAKNCTTPNTRAMLGRGIVFRHLYTVGQRQVDVTVRDRDCASSS